MIASLTGATQVLVVTEPTLSGEHDMESVLSLTRHFQIPTAVCVNKWALNPSLTERIEDLAVKAGSKIAGRVRYDKAVTRAQLEQKAVVELDLPISQDIRGVWEKVASL